MRDFDVDRLRRQPQIVHNPVIHRSAAQGFPGTVPTHPHPCSSAQLFTQFQYLNL